MVMGGYRVIGILSYCNLVMKYFLEDEVSSVWSILISCSSGIQSEVVVVMCVCISVLVVRESELYSYRISLLYLGEGKIPLVGYNVYLVL